MDVKVKLAQEWYNDTYSGKSWYTPIVEDGITGQGTCRALCKALQHEIGLTSGIDGIIGNATLNACPTVGPTTANTNLIKIVQCGFYCKGYECGDISGAYDAQTTAAAQAFRSDAGFPDNNGTMPPLFIEALLNTDAYVLISGGKSAVRNAQQYLNSHYFINMGNWGFIPCNGITDRNMMKGIIAALQYEEAGKTMSGVDGIYGDNTLNKAPVLSQGTSKSDYVKIAQMCLMCMMESDTGINGVFDATFKARIQTFQSHYCLTTATSGVIDRVTWASLLSSRGDISRPSLACDTSVILNSAKATALYNAGYRYIGRYLTGTVGGTRSKAMTASEVKNILDSGLRIFALFQEGVVTREKFTYEQGRIDAATAMEAARSLGIPYGEIIYFCIDYDMTDADITNYVLKYFKGIRQTFNTNYNRYRIGIYASRNVCTRVANRGYAISSFVSDMSTGFSGNLGYKIPDNWAFDQFYEFTFSGSGESFALDKTAYSGRYNGFNQVENHSDDDPIPIPTDEVIIDRYKELLRLSGISTDMNLALGQTYQIETPIMSVEYKAAYSENFTFDSEGVTNVSLNISNGGVSTSIVAEAQNIINGLDNSVSADFEALGGLALYTTFTNEITNGTVTLGIGSSAGFLKIIYKYKVKIWANDTSTKYLYVQVSVIYRNRPVDPELEQITESAITIGSAVALVLVAFLGGYALGSLGLLGQVNALISYLASRLGTS